MKTTKGFTIIEVLIAMAIFAIGILGVAKMQILATGYNTSSRVYTEAASLGAGQIEELINLEYEDSDLQLEADHGPYEKEDVGPNNIYDIEWRVNPAVSTAGVHVKRIDITVTQDKDPDREFNATYYKAIDY